MGRRNINRRENSCCSRRGHHHGIWLLVAAIAGLYLLGKRQRPDVREMSVEAIDRPEVTEAWLRLSNLPHFRLLRNWLVSRVLRGWRHPRILDIGCGAGQLLLSMTQRIKVREAVGIDLSGDMVALARASAESQGLDAQFLEVDAAEMPFPDASFDLIVSTISLHHWQNPHMVLREARRVLAPGGRIYIFDLRRNASPVLWGVAALLTRFIVPGPVREAEEPLASLKSSYTPWEAAVLASKAGWEHPRISQGPLWMVLEMTLEQ